MEDEYTNEEETQEYYTSQLKREKAKAKVMAKAAAKQAARKAVKKVAKTAVKAGSRWVVSVIGGFIIANLPIIAAGLFILFVIIIVLGALDHVILDTIEGLI